MKFNTLCLHAGQEPDLATSARGVSVVRSAAYVFRDTEHAANLFALKESGNIYSRLMNPTQDVLEKRMAALEGGAAALATSSGTSAVFYSIINVCRAGDEIVSAKNLYGGTYTLFNDILPQFGITTRFVDGLNPNNFSTAITQRTKALYCETIGNPSLDIIDIKAVSDIAHKNGIPLIVDSTFTTPYLMRPIEHGADIVVHSLTKWLGGHGTGIGGVVIDSGLFDWRNGNFPLMTEPDSSYHGVRYAYDLGEMNHIAYIMRMRLVPMRNIGACISPDNAWMFLQGLETLHVRMPRHCSNALHVAKFLSQHSNVAWVRYPGLETDPAFMLANRYFASRGYGAMVVFGIKGGLSAGAAFINKLKLVSHLANVGDAKSLAIHPATTTHAQLSEEEQRAGGITPDLIRLSIGIEDVEDIVADINQALA